MRMLLLLSVAVLAGCQSKPVSEMSYSELMATANAIEKRCAEQGAPRGSTGFELCVRQEVNREHATRERNYASRMAAAQAMGQMSQTYQQNRPVNCTSNRVGGYVQTNCY